MPLRNRVTPRGELVAVAAHGLLLGNRGGRIHDPRTRQLGNRRWTSRRWICCVTDFRGRRRAVWGQGYTELFFLDEVTALAAGHRPCMECRRAEALAFRAAVQRGGAFAEMPRCDDLDAVLHAERLAGRERRLHRTKADDVPDGAMVLGPGGEALAIRGDGALIWSASGYLSRSPRPRGVVDALTPPASMAALRAGYRPLWHPSSGSE